MVWLADKRNLALFSTGTIVRDPHHRESPTCREQDEVGGNELNTDNRQINVATKIEYLPRKHSPANCGKNDRGVFLLLP